jgi:mannose-6-phosphate isomerase-like protein (cupin superfamily)
VTKPLNALDVETTVLSWGVAKWLVSQNSPSSTMSCGGVVVLPGKSHEWHVHDESDEIVYVLSGHGLFGVGDDLRMPIGPGDAVYIPTGVGHDSHNPGWEPLRLLVMYGPAGPESGTPETAHLIVPPGEPVAMHTDIPDTESAP